MERHRKHLCDSHATGLVHPVDAAQHVAVEQHAQGAALRLQHGQQREVGPGVAEEGHAARDARRHLMEEVEERWQGSGVGCAGKGGAAPGRVGG